ncbi:MAG: PorP/SprF family type IX secretion system membrane protein [Bacteroidota bacterium]
MLKQRLYIFLFIVLGLCKESIAQDIHFSQFWASLHNTNPALVAYFDGTGRFSFNQRTQWNTVTKPYTTFMASYDAPIIKRPYRQDLFGLGVTAFRDVAGDSHFGTTQLNLSLSYIKALNRRNNNFVSFGLQLGGAQRNITYSELYFDEQFVNGRFDPSMQNSEQFSRSNFIFGDISVGSAWSFHKRYRQSYQVGISLSHLNQPKQSLFDDQNTRMDMKTMITFTSQQKASEDIDVYPMLMASFQGTYYEVLLGGQTRYIFSKNSSTYTTFNAGIFYRFGDAAFVMFGAEYMRYQFGISYDINTSKLHNASRYQGGWEISLNYLFNKNTPRKIKEVPCPIF